MFSPGEISERKKSFTLIFIFKNYYQGRFTAYIIIFRWQISTVHTAGMIDLDFNVLKLTYSMTMLGI